MAKYRIAELESWAAAALARIGVSQDDAHVTARLLVRSDARGVSTHGLARLSSYVERLQAAEFAVRPDIRVSKAGALWRADADGALGQLFGSRLVERAVTYCRESPVLWVAVRNVGHLGALGVIALEAAESGLMCLIGQRTAPVLSLEGFSGPGIGHNPLAFAAPAADGDHLVIDMACSVVARGQILLAARDGRNIPPGWALDANGEHTTDAEAAKQGALLPSGGYKGMGIAMIVECLSAALGVDADFPETVAMRLPEKGAVARESAFFLFLNPALINDSTVYFSYMEHWMRHYLSAAGETSRIPGRRGHVLEAEAQATGLFISDSIQQELRELGNALELPFSAQPIS